MHLNQDTKVSGVLMDMSSDHGLIRRNTSALHDAFAKLDRKIRRANPTYFYRLVLSNMHENTFALLN
jgi:hypothetical protein